MQSEKGIARGLLDAKADVTLSDAKSDLEKQLQEQRQLYDTLQEQKRVAIGRYAISSVV